MDFSTVWKHVILETVQRGVIVSPRGMDTLEVPQRTIVVDMRRPVLTVPHRKLNYRFMAAEAFWILSGDNRVSTIAPYNAKIADFSDNGETFFGAYGPEIVRQLEYVVDTLVRDNSSRQAGLTIWRESPAQTKDVPCTVAIFFSIRYGFLHTHVFMRSSDIWLGIPYDVFTFSMLGHLVCSLINGRDADSAVRPGKLYLTAASSHLYMSNVDAAVECSRADHKEQPETDVKLFADPGHLMATLRLLRDSKPGDEVRWWEL